MNEIIGLIGGGRRRWLGFSESQDQVINYLSSFAEVLNAGQSTVDTLRGWIIKDVEIFKAGTYRKITYTEQDIQDMVDNFDSLKREGKLDPVFKINHSEDARDQVGWILSVKKSGDLLLADIHVTEWEAFDKISNGTWQKVSAEIYLPEMSETEFGVNSFVLRAVAVVSIPQVKDIKGIVLNAERWELDKKDGNKPKGGNKPMKWLQKLAEMLGKTVEQLTDEERNLAVAMFGEYQTEEGTAGGSAGGAAGGAQIVITAKDFVALSEQFSKLDASNKDLAGQVAVLTKDSKKVGLEKRVQVFAEAGKILPAERESIMKFAEKLENEALEEYMASLEARPKIVQFGEGGTPQGGGDPDADLDKTMETYAETFGQKLYT